VAIILSRILNSELPYNQFVESYSKLSFKAYDSLEEISGKLKKSFEHWLTDEYIDKILNDKEHKLLIFVDRIKPSWFNKIAPLLQMVTFGITSLVNLVYRDSIRLLYQSICFHTCDTKPDIFDPKHDEYQYYKLTKENFREVLLASNSVPFLTNPVSYISGIGEGPFVDGGVLSYQLNSRVQDNYNGLVLSHNSRDKLGGMFLDTIYPFGSRLQPSFFDNCSVLHVNRNFINEVKKKLVY